MDEAAPVKILTVCTGNMCRSPLAEALLRHKIDQRGVPAVVTSAGLLHDGAPVTDEILELLRDRGLDGSTHRSRRLSGGTVTDADLVLGMAREHVREAVLLEPDVFPRAFTLKELVRLGSGIGPRLGREPLPSWLARAGADRKPTDLLGAGRDDDIEDPVGKRMAVYRDVATEIDQLTTRVVDLLWPSL